MGVQERLTLSCLKWFQLKTSPCPAWGQHSQSQGNPGRAELAWSWPTAAVVAEMGLGEHSGVCRMKWGWGMHRGCFRLKWGWGSTLGCVRQVVPSPHALLPTRGAQQGNDHPFSLPGGLCGLLPSGGPGRQHPERADGVCRSGWPGGQLGLHDPVRLELPRTRTLGGLAPWGCRAARSPGECC